MPHSDFTPDQQWLLGELDAPVRAARIKEMFEQRLRPLLDHGFTVRQTTGGATVSLGALTLITAYCEPEPPNADAVANFVAIRADVGDFRANYVEVQNKSDTARVALQQLEQALGMLRTYREEFAAQDIPMGWACD